MHDPPACVGHHRHRVELGCSTRSSGTDGRLRTGSTMKDMAPSHGDGPTIPVETLDQSFMSLMRHTV